MTAKELLADKDRHGAAAFVRNMPHCIEDNAVYTEHALAAAFDLPEQDIDWLLDNCASLRLPSGTRLYRGSMILGRISIAESFNASLEHAHADSTD